MPAEYQQGGVVEVHRSTTGAVDSWTRVNGDVTRVENLPVTPIEQEHTAGNYQTGETGNPTIYLNDHQDKATLKGLRRTRTYFALVFEDGTIRRTPKPVFPKSWDVPKAKVDEGDAELALSWNHSSNDEMLEVIAALTT
ncbi:MAG: hypothetical protein ABJ387_03470 [Balneola sp.]